MATTVEFLYARYARVQLVHTKLLIILLFADLIIFKYDTIILTAAQFAHSVTDFQFQSLAEEVYNST